MRVCSWERGSCGCGQKSQGGALRQGVPPHVRAHTNNAGGRVSQRLCLEDQLDEGRDVVIVCTALHQPTDVALLCALSQVQSHGEGTAADELS